MTHPDIEANQALIEEAKAWARARWTDGDTANLLHRLVSALHCQTAAHREAVKHLALIAQGWTVIESDGQVMTILAPDDWEGTPTELVVDSQAALAHHHQDQGAERG